MLEPLRAPSPPAAEPRTLPVRDKVRLRFRKDSDVRLLSHHDLLRCFERACRRAELPVLTSHGFNPRPRLVFALSLPLGVIGCEEVLEIELDGRTLALPAEEILERLRRQMPPGLALLSVRRIGPKETAQVRSLCYRISLPPERIEALRGRLSEVLSQTELWAWRGKPKPGQVPQSLREAKDTDGHRVNLRPFLRDLRLSVAESTPTLEIDLWLTNTGTARPAEVLALLDLADLIDAGIVVERSRLELHDERVMTND